ncbi:MAG: hypothetical protein WBL35_07165, partial [Ornithinibacter sp.]
MGRVFATGLLADLTNRQLDEVCGTVTVARGLAYAKQGRVIDLEVRRAGADATGWVGGSAGQTYETQVSLHPVSTPAAGPTALHRWHSHCTCPMVGDCKHAVAVAATVRERQRAPGPEMARPPALETASPPAPAPTWE